MPDAVTVKLPSGDFGVQIQVVAGNGGVGSYHLRLWGPAGNNLVMDKPGTFLTPTGDTFDLPVQGQALAGYFVESLATLSQVKGIDRWSQTLIVKMAGQPDQSYPHSGDFAAGNTVTDQIILQFS